MPRAFLLKRLSESDSIGHTGDYILRDKEEDIAMERGKQKHEIPNITIENMDEEDHVFDHQTYQEVIQDIHKQIEEVSMTTDCLHLPPLSGLYLPEKYRLLQKSLFSHRPRYYSADISFTHDSNDEDSSDYVIPSPSSLPPTSPSYYLHSPFPQKGVDFELSLGDRSPIFGDRSPIDSFQSPTCGDLQHPSPTSPSPKQTHDLMVTSSAKSIMSPKEISPMKISPSDQQLSPTLNAAKFLRMNPLQQLSVAKKKNKPRVFFPDKEKEHQCCVCKKTFQRASSLSNHKLIHENSKIFKCGDCQMSFLRKSDLGKHLVIHSGNKPYECKTCGKRFSQSSNMLTHQRRHSGVRPYSCELCGKSFYRKVDVRRHSSVHCD